MQANLILPLQSNSDAAPRGVGNSLGEVAGKAQGGGFFSQLQQVGQQLSDQRQAFTGKQSQLPPELLALLGEPSSGSVRGAEFSVEVALAASEELPEGKVDPEQLLAMISPAAADQARVSLADAATTGRGLPQEGAVLPQAAMLNGKAIGQAKVAQSELELDVEAGELGGQAELSGQLQDRRVAALDRARFEMSNNAEAIRQQLEPTPGGKPELADELTPELTAQGLMADKLAPNISVATDTSSSVVSTSAGTATTPLTGVDSARSTAATDPTMTRTQMSMNTPMGEAGWAEEMGSRLRVLAERGSQTAEIRLNPPELGSMEVKITNDGERTSVTFFAQNSATRDALEAAMPRLREMFDESGLQLADANVSDQKSMSQDGESSNGDGTSFVGGGDDDLSAEGGQSTTVASVSDSLVDYYI